jgi:hypothetical protein
MNRILFNVGRFFLIHASGDNEDALIFAYIPPDSAGRGFSISWRPTFEIRPLFR